MQFFSTFAGSFHSAAAYQRAHQREGLGLAYSFGVVVLVSLVLTVFFGQMFLSSVFKPQGNNPLSFFDDMTQQLAAQVPVMTYKDGVLTTNEPRAYEIRLHVRNFGYDEEGIIAVIDTTGATTHENMQAPLLFTAHEVVRREKNELRITPYKEAAEGMPNPMIINRAVVEDTMHQVRNWLYAHAVFICAVLGVFAVLSFGLMLYVQRIVLMLLVSVGGLLLGLMLKNRVSYATLMRLSAVALTPVTVFDVAATVSGRHVGGFHLFLCGLVMLAAALAVTRKEPLATAA